MEAQRDRTTAVRDRDAGAHERADAETDRETAQADRGWAGDERTEADLDRDAASENRNASAKDRDSASLDSLTGVYLRGAGLIELERELTRAQRVGLPLIIAFVDVDNLKAVNDSKGHHAGDQLLRDVATTLRAQLRSYDLIIRYGGDEFVCALSGVTMGEAESRFASVDAALARASEQIAVTVGLTEQQPADTLESLVERADSALYRNRRQRRSSP